MTCIKTGFHAFIEPYGLYAVGDAFAFAHTKLFRISGTQFTPMRERIHYKIIHVEQWWDRDRPPSTLVGVAVELGYEGLPIAQFNPDAKLSIDSRGFV